MVVGAVDTVDNPHRGRSRHESACGSPVGDEAVDVGPGVDGQAVPTRSTQAAWELSAGCSRSSTVVHNALWTTVERPALAVVLAGLSVEK